MFWLKNSILYSSIFFFGMEKQRWARTTNTMSERYWSNQLDAHGDNRQENIPFSKEWSRRRLAPVRSRKTRIGCKTSIGQSQILFTQNWYFTWFHMNKLNFKTVKLNTEHTHTHSTFWQDVIRSISRIQEAGTGHSDGSKMQSNVARRKLQHICLCRALGAVCLNVPAFMPDCILHPSSTTSTIDRIVRQ